MSHKIEWDGEILSARAICKKEGVSIDSVYKRMSLTGEDAKTVILYFLNQPNRGNREKIEINGIIADLRTHCKKLGISYRAITSRIRETGESAKEAIIYYLNQPNKGNREKIELNGKLLDVRTYCKKLNYDYRLVTRYKASQIKKSYTEVLQEWPSLSQDEVLNSIHLYDIWHGMMERCYNSKHPAYKWYGGKKINPTRVYEKWQEYLGFKEDNWEEYINHVKKYGRDQTSIDRNNEEGNYCPENCTWGDWEQQGKNKSTTKYFLSTGETLKHHCAVNNYKYSAIRNYITKYNLIPDEALARYLKNKKDM